ncbi:hypothetical protein HYDPIDRAFT_117225 [Hydnomerulius pinastri MD-312]|uniref:Uncharacterized protein n=1 Tax=Hydnomerulius pinastri MD-312 TaxID=994086 RepID=A0A0C9WA84_9AGAM|nr:hypothetical protein HYDPIDRAFT_117225 [Hydnomerulius pinastri MD-312]
MEFPEGFTTPSPTVLDTFVQHARQQIHNPDPLTNYIHIPPDLSPEWQAFFGKELAFAERKCGTEMNENRILWEKRGLRMEDEGLDEFNMMFASTVRKEEGNRFFRQNDMESALEAYTLAVRMFPLPDAQLNLAQAALQSYRYEIAEEQCTDALTTGLMQSRMNQAKAYYRRAKARRCLGKLTEALGDIQATLALESNDHFLQEESAEICRVLELSQEEQTSYIVSRPKAEAARESWAGILAMGVVEIDVPGSFDLGQQMRAQGPPMF